jgi:hypothetical protein
MDWAGHQIKKHMKKMAFVCALISSTFLPGCENEGMNVMLDKNESMSFSGTFRTIDSDENLRETVELTIVNGRYESFTSLPGGYGAGKVEINGNYINFIDTVFTVTLAIYGPSYTPSGEHYYQYDGKNLKLFRKKNVGSIEYRLRSTK